MSDHAPAVNEPVDPAEVSATSEAVEQDERQGAATPSESSPEKESDKESGAQKRIRELVWRQREAERRAEEAERRLRELESQKPAGQPKSELVIPVESDYDDADEYRRALDTYTRSVLSEEAERRERQRTQQETESQRQARLKAHQDRCANYASEHADFIEDIKQATVPVTAPMQEYMLDSDRSAELTHYLAKNPDHAFRIADMSPIAAARELAKVELALEQAQPKKLSDAPPPMSDVEDGPTKAPTEIRDGMTAEEFVRARGGYRLR